MNAIPSCAAPLKIGTRGSPLALAQAAEVRARLCAAWDLPHDAFDIVVIKTSGDIIQDKPLRLVGGKGLFTKEIEEQLLDGRIDIAVHSMKDMPVMQPSGLCLDTYLPREDVRDAFIAPDMARLADMPIGAIVGTSSLRRRAQMLCIRPDIKVVEFRGNVQTRMRKLADGVADCTFLAMAGLNRLGMGDYVKAAIEPKDMLPAVAQGAIGIERRRDDRATAHLLKPLHDVTTEVRLQAERAFLARLDGSCNTPIAGLATLAGDKLTLHGEILRPDGTQRISAKHSGPAYNSVQIGVELAETLLAQAGDGFFDWHENNAPTNVD